MVSNKYHLGDLIKQRREKNPGGNLPIRGVSKDGLQPPKQIDADTSIYNVYYRNDFIFNPARMELGSIAFNNEYDKAICSSLYEVFYVYRTDLVIPEYLALFVKHSEFARCCNYIGNGSAREYCRFDNISGIPIILPSLPEQRKIVHDYQVITGRIELLRKMNENLEAQMDALFKEHVIDNPKYDFNEHIDDNIEYVNGLAMQDFRPQDGEIPLPVIKIRELTQGCCDESSEYCSPLIDPSRIVNTGDLVFSWSGSLRLSFWSSSRAGLNQHLFKVTSRTYPDWFMYLWTKHYLEDFKRIAENKGTTFGHIKREDLHAKMVKSLDAEGMNRLNTIFGPIQMSVMSYAREIQQLQALKKICLGSIGVTE